MNSFDLTLVTLSLLMASASTVVSLSCYHDSVFTEGDVPTTTSRSCVGCIKERYEFKNEMVRSDYSCSDGRADLPKSGKCKHERDGGTVAGDTGTGLVFSDTRKTTCFCDDRDFCNAAEKQAAANVAAAVVSLLLVAAARTLQGFQQ